MAQLMITPKQIKMLHVLARNQGMDEEDLHAFIKGRLGADSLRALTRSQGIQAIDQLKLHGGELPNAVYRRASYPQRGLISALGAKVFGNDPARFRGFLENQYGVSSVNFLPYEKVNGAINALRAMKGRGYGDAKSS